MAAVTARSRISTAQSGLSAAANTFSVAFGDYDRDGDLDLFMTHWNDLPLTRGMTTQHLWNNDGAGHFTDVSVASRIATSILADAPNHTDFTFTPNFADIDSDGWPDLLIASDYNHSQVFHNDARRHVHERHRRRRCITDENGMGAAVGDFDNDGDLDWFVSSIWDPNGVPEGMVGCDRQPALRNRGDGTFVDVTTETGVRMGYWGWGSTFADFDQDGWLDLLPRQRLRRRRTPISSARTSARPDATVHVERRRHLHREVGRHGDPGRRPRAVASCASTTTATATSTSSC